MNSLRSLKCQKDIASALRDFILFFFFFFIMSNATFLFQAGEKIKRKSEREREGGRAREKDSGER